jgi:hypothetical protein
LALPDETKKETRLLRAKLRVRGDLLRGNPVSKVGDFPTNLAEHFLASAAIMREKSRESNPTNQ